MSLRHLLIMGQAGFLEHDETVVGIRTFAREVYPRLKELYPDSTGPASTNVAHTDGVVHEPD